MNKIIENFLNIHKTEYSIERLDTETAFEHFANKCADGNIGLKFFCLIHKDRCRPCVNPCTINNGRFSLIHSLTLLLTRILSIT